ncbi:hypothetical protein A2U01_0110832, partial [Trifolium medium]|nr:hypothetical protein [Trifolium medium]
LVEIEEESSADGQEEELEDEEFAFFTRKFQQWARKHFKSNGSRNSGYKDKKPGHFIADCPEMSSKE